MRRLSPSELAWYDHVPPAVARRVRITCVPVLPPGADGMALGPLVLLRAGVGAGPADPSPLLAHELVHVRQWADLGAARFLWRYLRGYAANLWRLRRHRAAYLAIPLEVEAREEASRWCRAHAAGGPPATATGPPPAPGTAAPPAPRGPG